MSFPSKQIPNVFVAKLVEKLSYVNLSIFFSKGVTFYKPLSSFCDRLSSSVMTASQFVSLMSVHCC